MEGANRGAILVPGSGFRVPGFRDELADAFLHFARGFVGEGDGENVSRGNAALDHVADPERDDPRLAGAGAGENKDRAFGRLDGQSLLRVERT
jgi:hypothetical protein